MGDFALKDHPWSPLYEAVRYVLIVGWILQVLEDAQLGI